MSYGFEINDNLGNLALNSSISTVRIVHQQFCTWDYNSSFSVPNFDSTKGEYYMRPHFVVAEMPSFFLGPYTIASTGTNYDYDFEGIKINTGGAETGWLLTFAALNKPTLSWNNSTKVMSVTKATQPPFSSVDNPPRGDGGDYTILFFEVA
jgi:hypothetical protein